MSVQIAPSILSADFAALGAAVAARRARRRRSHSRRRHGRPLRAEHHDRPAGRASRCKRVARVPLDVHLMITDPDRYIEAFADAGADDDLGARRSAAPPASHRSRDQGARRQGRRRAQSVDAGRRLEQIAGDVDFVLVMSVNPGFGGQTFIPRSDAQGRGGAGAARSRRQHRGARSRSTAASTLEPRAASSPPGRASSWPATPIFGTPRSRAGHARAEGASPTPSLRPQSPAAPVSPTTLHVAGARALRRNRPDGRRLLRQLSGLVRGGRTDLLRHAGWTYREMEADGFALPVIEAHCEYRQPARYDDELDIETQRHAAVAVRVRFDYEVVRSADDRAPGRPATPSTPRSTRDGRPCRLPERVRIRESAGDAS